MTVYSMSAFICEARRRSSIRHVEGMVPFSYLVESNESEMDMHCDITSALEQLSVSLMGGDSVEVKAVLAFHSFLRKSVKADVITDLKMEKFRWKSWKRDRGLLVIL